MQGIAKDCVIMNCVTVTNMASHILIYDSVIANIQAYSSSYVAIFYCSENITCCNCIFQGVAPNTLSVSSFKIKLYNCLVNNFSTLTSPSMNNQGMSAFVESFNHIK